MSDISDLLNASHLAHWRYMQHLPRMTAMPGGPVATSGGDAREARRALHEAADLRAQADTADPDHADRAWLDEVTQFPHAELSAFYAQQVGQDDVIEEKVADAMAKEKAKGKRA